MKSKNPEMKMNIRTSLPVFAVLLISATSFFSCY
jgi:hypothetical protein